LHARLGSVTGLAPALAASIVALTREDCEIGLRPALHWFPTLTIGPSAGQTGAVRY